MMAAWKEDKPIATPKEDREIFSWDEPSVLLYKGDAILKNPVDARVRRPGFFVVFQKAHLLSPRHLCRIPL
jgi:hypothetical protein